MKVDLNASEVHRILAEKNLSLKRLAQKNGVNSGYLSLVMTGRQHPSPKMWKKILSGL
jgi:transcriptional regulator with XRE-family HTH domain